MVDAIIVSVCVTGSILLIAYQAYKRIISDYHHWKLSLRDREYITEKDRLELERLQKEIVYSQIQSPYGHMVVYDHKTGKYIEFEKSVSFAPPQDEQIVDQAGNYPFALPLLMPVQRLMVAGGQNTGKTSLLQWLTSERLKTGSRVIIIDSHCFPGKWPGQAEVIGKNRDYQAIESAFDDLLHLMDDRYREYSSGQVGERQHHHITLVIDEFSMIAKNTGNTKDFITTALMEFRKVNLDLILAGQSTRAGNMGLRGSYDLFESFDCLCHLKMESGQRKAYLNFGDGNEIEAIHPGAYGGVHTSGHTQGDHHQTPGFDHNFDTRHTSHESRHNTGSTGRHTGSHTRSHDDHVMLCENECDRNVTRFFRNGFSISAIAEKIFGGRSGKRNSTIKDILQKYRMI